MAVVAAAGPLFAQWRLDPEFAPALLVLFAIYVCVILSLVGARRAGRPWLDALCLVFFFGPFGVIFAWSEYPPPAGRVGLRRVCYCGPSSIEALATDGPQ
jgi:hypothetical protein